MGFVIDPSKEDSNEGGGSSTRRPDVRAGDKVLMCAGIKYGTSQKGNPKIDVCWVCVEDPDGGQDVSGLVWDTFTLTEAAAWRLQQAAKALGQTAAWDAEDKSTTLDVFMAGPVKAEIRIVPKWSGDGNKADVAKYFSWSGNNISDLDPIAIAAENWYKEWLSRSQNKDNAGNRSSRRRGQVQADDIPF